MDEKINGRTPEEIKRWVDGRATCNTCPKEHEVGCEYGERTEDCQMTIDTIAYIEHLESERDAALAKVPKWISVEERKPEFPCIYWDGINQIGITKTLATITLKNGKTVYLSDMFLKAFPDITQGEVDDCTHIMFWMPLPEPPEEGE